MLIRTKGNQQWRSPSITAYEDEAAIQTLLGASPDLLPNANGNRMAIAREVAVGVGSIDLIGVDPIGAITLVECKLRANPEIRRHVVGQVLAYASALWELNYEWFDRAFTARAGQSLASSVAALKPDEWDEETFRTNVDDNLKAGRFRLIIAVDQITDELGRTISFLNTHTTPDLQVLALELRYMADSEVEMLIPTIYGTESVHTKISTSPDVRWDEQRFFGALNACCTPKGYQAAREIFRRAREIADSTQWGTGSLPSVTFRFASGGKNVPLLSLYEWPKGKGKAAVNFEYLVGVLPDATVQMLADQLRKIPEVAELLTGLETAGFKKRPTIPFDGVLSSDDRLNAFWNAITSIADQHAPVNTAVNK